MSRQTFRGPHKLHTGCVKSLAATGHSATQWWLGDPNNGSFQIMNGISFQDKNIILKARRKSKKWYVHVPTLHTIRGCKCFLGNDLDRCHEEYYNGISLILISTLCYVEIFVYLSEHSAKRKCNEE